MKREIGLQKSKIRFMPLGYITCICCNDIVAILVITLCNLVLINGVIIAILRKLVGKS